MMVKTVDIRDAPHQLTELLSQVAAGSEIILADGSQPLARLVPITSSVTRRVPGLHPGSISVSEDFDEPLSDEFWTLPS